MFYGIRQFKIIEKTITLVYNRIMSIMVAGLYDALKDAGAKDELARKAAEEVANYDMQLAEVKSDLRLLKWMVGFNLAISIAVLFQIFGV